MRAKGEDMFEADSFTVLVANWVDMPFSKQTKPLSATTRGAPALDSSDLGLGVGTTDEKTRGLASAAAELPSLAGERGVCQVPEGEQVSLQVVQGETGLVIDNQKGGLLVLRLCTHADVISTNKQAHRSYRDKRIRALSCGFHLDFPPNMREALGLIPATSQDHVARSNPMPCRRLPTHAHAADDPEYVQLPVDTMIGFGTSAKP